MCSSDLKLWETTYHSLYEELNFLLHSGLLEFQDGRQRADLQKREGGFSFSLSRNLLYADRTYEHSLSHDIHSLWHLATILFILRPQPRIGSVFGLFIQNVLIYYIMIVFSI